MVTYCDAVWVVLTCVRGEIVVRENGVGLECKEARYSCDVVFVSLFAVLLSVLAAFWFLTGQAHLIYDVDL